MFNYTKSPETFNNSTVKTLVDLMLKEQRHQRADLATIKRQLHTLINDSTMQKQVDDYYEDDKPSPQTDTDKQNDSDAY